MSALSRIPAQSAVAFTLDEGDLLEVVDPEGEQVADLVAFARPDTREYLSSGRSLDYASRLFLTRGERCGPTAAAPCCASKTTAWAATTSC